MHCAKIGKSELVQGMFLFYSLCMHFLMVASPRSRMQKCFIEYLTQFQWSFNSTVLLPAKSSVNKWKGSTWMVDLLKENRLLILFGKQFAENEQ